MAALSIRDLDDAVKARLQVRAAGHGRSMEAEVREILTAAVTEPQEDVGLARALLDRFGGAGGADLDLPARNELPWAAAVDLGS